MFAVAISAHEEYSAALHTARLHTRVSAVISIRISMVRLKIHELMKARNITAYALSKATKISYPSAYRLSRSGGVFGRLHAETLDALCQFFDVQPGRLLQWTR
jgi:DNA-binding Xre family transcriptional regulator